jgi:hypothetical protein
MIAATSMLRPPPARVGKISDKIVLPRSVELKKVVAGAAGMLLFATLWLFPIGLIFGYNFQTLLITLVAGIAAGVLVVTVSPLRGESLTRWVGLTFSSRRADKVQIGGRTVRAYIGIAPLATSAAGVVRVTSGAIEVLAGSYDERGVPVPTAQIRREKLETIGGRVSAPGAHEGFAPIGALGDAPNPAGRPAQTGPRRYGPAVSHSSFMPSGGQPPPAATGPVPSPPPGVPPRNETPATNWPDPFALPPARLPKK